MPLAHRTGPSHVAAATGTPETVGSLTLRPCAWYAAPSAVTSTVPGSPAIRPPGPSGSASPSRRPVTDRRPALGTLVPHEGGPGYSTTGTGTSYAAMYGPHAAPPQPAPRRPARHGPLGAARLPRAAEPEDRLLGRRPDCGRSLGPRSDDYTSARSADDLAAVIRALGLGRVDLYGDSYGTFFAQVFAGRHRGDAAQRRARQRLPDVRRDGVVPDPGPGDAELVPQGLPAVHRLPPRRRGLRRGDPARARAGAPTPLARRLARRRRPPDAGDGQRAEPRHGGLRRDVRPVHLPRADGRPPVRAARRPRPAAAPRRAGHRRRHERRSGARLQRGARRGCAAATTTRSSTT